MLLLAAPTSSLGLRYAKYEAPQLLIMLAYLNRSIQNLVQKIWMLSFDDTICWCYYSIIMILTKPALVFDLCWR